MLPPTEQSQPGVFASPGRPGVVASPGALQPSAPVFVPAASVAAGVLLSSAASVGNDAAETN
jgi:hypothetical protein